MRRLFDPDSPVMSALSSLMDFFVLSLLTLMCSLPVITAGAAWCALYGSMADMAAGASVHLHKLMDIEPDTVYREADKITDELMKSFIKIEKPQNNQKKKSYLKLQLFDMCQYDNGLLYFQISKKMTGYFLNLKKDFTKPLLNDFLKMKSNYSIEIWHLIQREMKSIKPNSTDIIQFDLSLEELRAVTGTQDKLKQMVHFKDKCFDKALREIYDNCGVNITYQNIRIGRKIVGFRCTAVSVVHIDTDNIPDDVKERARRGKERIRNNQKGEKI